MDTPDLCIARGSFEPATRQRANRSCSRKTILDSERGSPISVSRSHSVVAHGQSHPRDTLLRTLIHDHFFYLLELICAEGAAAIGKHAVGSGVTNKTLEILHIT